MENDFQKARDTFKDFLKLLSLEFGRGGTHQDIFQLFESMKYSRFNLMFSDETYSFKNLVDVAGGTRTTYYKWAVNPQLVPSGIFHLYKFLIVLCFEGVACFFNSKFVQKLQFMRN